MNAPGSAKRKKKERPSVSQELDLTAYITYSADIVIAGESDWLVDHFLANDASERILDTCQ